ncbi:MAG: nucleoside triphosphate pyrophosphohydrolase [Myxococcota bacterium]
MTNVPTSPDARFERAAAAVERLCRIMAQLRAPGGCPWDREQTLASLKTYLLEETYETLDAIDAGDPGGHRDELGDLLLQIVFQSEITQEAGAFGLAEVATAIADKLVRRHPHVFGDTEARTASDVSKNWERIKAEERAKSGKKDAKGTLHGVPKAFPALLRALRTGEKAAAVGFDWTRAADVRAKVYEEWSELDQALLRREKDANPTNQAQVAEEIGDLLFSIANLSRHLGVDPEDALRRTLEKFQKRFEYLEQELAKKDKVPSEATIDELERLWEDAKLFFRT